MYFDTRNAYDPTKNDCVACDTGYFTLDPIITNSLVSGTTGTTSQSACICDAGYGRSTKDGAGNAITITSANAKSVECEKCERGYYKIEKNDEICILAPKPEYKDTSGLQHAPQTDGVLLWLDFVQPAIVSTSDVLVHIKTAFLSGLVAFVLALLFQKSQGMEVFAGANAAHASQLIAKLCIGLHVICSVVLLYWMSTRDNLVGRSSWPRVLSGTKYEVSIIQHPPRPLIAIFFVSVGVGAAYHPLPAVISIAAALVDMIANVISAVEMRAYANLLLVDQAPLGQGYTTQLVLNYYYRDLVSIALCSCIIFSLLHVVITIGYLPSPGLVSTALWRHVLAPPSKGPHERDAHHQQQSADADGDKDRLTYDKIDLGGMDRINRMRQQRDAALRRRVLMDRQGPHNKHNQGEADAGTSSDQSLLRQRLNGTLGQEKAARHRNTYFGDGADSDEDAGSSGSNQDERPGRGAGVKGVSTQMRKPKRD